MGGLEQLGEGEASGRDYPAGSDAEMSWLHLSVARSARGLTFGASRSGSGVAVETQGSSRSLRTL
jgi:hypothetical protein